MTPLPSHLGTIIDQLPLDTSRLMELVEEIVITYLRGGGSDHYHQGRLGHLLAIGVGECRLVFLQGFPGINCVPAFLGVELGVERVSQHSVLVEVRLPMRMDIIRYTIPWGPQFEEVPFMDLSHSGDLIETHDGPLDLLCGELVCRIALIPSL